MEVLYYYEDGFFTMKAKRLTNKQFETMKAKKNEEANETKTIPLDKKD